MQAALQGSAVAARGPQEALRQSWVAALTAVQMLPSWYVMQDAGLEQAPGRYTWEVTCLPSTTTTVHMCMWQHSLPGQAHTHARRQLSRVLCWLSKAVRRSGDHGLPPGFPAASICALFKLPSTSLHIGGPSSCSWEATGPVSSLRWGYFLHEPWDCHFGGVACGNSHLSFSFMNWTSPSFSAHRIPDDIGVHGAGRERESVAPQSDFQACGGWRAQACCPPELSPDLTLDKTELSSLLTTWQCEVLAVSW